MLNEIPFEATNAELPQDARSAKEELYRLLEEKAKRKRESKIDELFTDTGPNSRENYRKHIQFFNAGRDYRERVIFGGNRTGKSVAGATEVSYHLTGLYPNWWAGKRFGRPVQVLACGKEAKITRDTVQQILVGKPDEFGTGLLPGNCLDRDKCTSSRAAAGLFDGVQVRHVSGGWSMLRFRSYDQGRTAFEGVERDVIWEDEEAPQDIHNENIMRTMTTGGIVLNTFTPLKGETPLVRDLLNRAKEGTVFSINVWWDDVGHITNDMIEDMKKRYPKHELRARRFGEPQLGSGAIFTADEDSYVIRAVPLPDYWPRVFGLDFGWVHPTAGAWLAHDRETNTIYVYSEHRRSQAEVAVHVGAIKARGDWIPGIAETAGTNQADGKRMIELYKGHGLNLRKVVKGPGSVESGIMRIQERFSNGTLKIMDTCPQLISEIRRYHRDEKGAVVEEADDLIDALRYGESGLKYAKTRAEARGGPTGGNVREINFFPSRRIA
jgi:phage terminase large subunit-like protein